MEEERQESFSFRINGEDDNEVYENDRQDTRLEKLNRRVTRISILIPCIIAAMLAIGYFGIQRRMVATQDTESRNVERITSNFDQQIAGIAQQLQAISENTEKELRTYRKEFEAYKKQRGDIDARLAKAEKNIASINDAKADKKEQDQYLAQMKASLDPVTVEIGKLKEQLQVQNRNYMEKLKGMTEIVEGSVTDSRALQKRMDELARGRVDKATLDLELLKAKKSYQLEISQMLKSVQSSFAGVYKELAALKNGRPPAVAPLSAPPPAGKPAELPSLSSGASALPPAGPGKAGTGNVTEQDLQ